MQWKKSSAFMFWQVCLTIIKKILSQVDEEGKTDTLKNDQVPIKQFDIHWTYTEYNLNS